MGREKIQLSLDEIENKKEYYTQLEKWTLNNQGDSYVYIGQYISVNRLEELKKNNQGEIVNVLLSTHNILIKCIEKNNQKTLRIKEQENHNKIAQYVTNARQIMEQNLTKIYESPQIYIDIIYLYLDSIKEGFSNKNINNIYLNFIKELDIILLKDISDNITQYQQNDNENTHPIELQMIKVKKIFQSFLSNFTKEENIEISTSTECLFFDALPNIRNYFYAFYYPPKKNNTESTQYTTILQTLQENIRSINYIFPDMSEDGVHPLSEELFKILLEYISTIIIKPTKNEDHLIILKNIRNILADFIIKVYKPKSLKDAASHTISLSKEFIDINTSLNQLLEIKKYDESIDVGSPRHIFIQIKKYLVEVDDINLANSITKLKECENKEISNLLSNDELKELLKIIIQQEEYIFAARISKLINQNSQ